MKQLLLVLALVGSLVGKSQAIHYYDSTGIEYDYDPRVVTYDSLGNAYYAVEDTVKLPYSVAKQVAKDLVSGDSAKAILDLTKEQLTLTEQKVVLKDSIISNHVQKGIMYEERIKNEQAKFDTQGLFVKDLQKQNKKLKVKLLFTKITLSTIIGGITYLYFTK